MIKLDKIFNQAQIIDCLRLNDGDINYCTYFVWVYVFINMHVRIVYGDTIDLIE